MENKVLHSTVIDHFNDLYAYLGNKFGNLATNFNDMYKRLDEIDQKLISVDQRFSQMDEKLEALSKNHEYTFELKFLSAKIDHIEKQMFKIQHQE